MLYIMYGPDGTFQDEKVWHTGKPVPEIPLTNICRLQADGDELLFINARFPGYAVRGVRVAHFVGDVAKNIYCNLHQVR